MRRVVAFVLSCILAAAAQQVGQNAPLEGNATTTIKVSSQLVVEAVWSGIRKAIQLRG
jgi:hypothetical protein